jgi:hypothetical protein
MQSSEASKNRAHSGSKRRRRSSSPEEAAPPGSAVCLYLPAGVEIPAFYTAADQDARKITDAMRVGATAVENSLSEMRTSQYARSLAAEREALVAERDSCIAQERALHQQSLASLTAELNRRGAQANLELELELKRARMQREEAEARLSREMGLAEAAKERDRAFFQSQLGAVQAALTNVQQEREFAKEQLALKERVAERSVHNSSIKGAEGEADVERIIKQAFAMCPGFSMINESKMAGRGDRLTTIMGLRVMWEIKSHAALRDNAAGTGVKRKVEKKDVEKLLDNASAAHDFDACVMVALHTNITGHDKHPVESEYVGRVLIIYVNSLFCSPTQPIDIMQWNVGCLLSAHAKLKEVTEISSAALPAGGAPCSALEDAGAAEQQGRIGECALRDGASPPGGSRGSAEPSRAEETAAAAVKLADQIAAYVTDASRQHAERKKLLQKHLKLVQASVTELMEDQQRAEMATQEGLSRLLHQARAMVACSHTRRP